jgi:hypothetical protein
MNSNEDTTLDNEIEPSKLQFFYSLNEAFSHSLFETSSLLEFKEKFNYIAPSFTNVEVYVE